MDTADEFVVTDRMQDGVLVIAFQGKLTERNARAMAGRYFEILGRHHESRVIADVRGLHGHLPDAFVYFLLRDLPPAIPGVRGAVVERPENRASAGFLETTGHNAGYKFRCFFDYEEALAWVLEDSPPG